MTALDTWQVDDLLAMVRRAAPFAALPESAFTAVLDMLAGRYPSDAFAELRPRVVWDRVAGTVTGRPGAQRLAVTSGRHDPRPGPVRRLPGGRRPQEGRRAGSVSWTRRWSTSPGWATSSRSAPRSWRIEDITRDRVLVSPAPGVPGRLPFWKGDQLGRPLELGRAVGAFLREVGAPAPGRRPAAAARRGPRRLGRRQRAVVSGRAAPGLRPRPGRPHDRRGAVPRRAGRLAGRRPLPVRRPGARPLGARARRQARPSGTAWTPRSCTPTTASCCGCRTPT